MITKEKDFIVIGKIKRMMTTTQVFLIIKEFDLSNMSENTTNKL